MLLLVESLHAGTSCPSEYRAVTFVRTDTASVESRAKEGGYEPLKFGWGGLAKLKGGEEHEGLQVLDQYKRGETDQQVIHEGVITSTYPAGFSVRQANGDVYELNSNRGEIEKVFVRQPSGAQSEIAGRSATASNSRPIATIDYCSRCAAAGGGRSLIRAMEVAIKDRGLSQQILVDHQGGCRSQCNSLLNVSVRSAVAPATSSATSSAGSTSQWSFNSYGLDPAKMKPRELLDNANRIIDEILRHD